ncbi:OmpA family protein [Desertivirga brevis]|uniref:OmpA family protein n=1 Tax=Desertivirga brevis TaxID=2810310 RepID=UPI001A973BE0|nr:OmpA family protein [Pedobacter sp. SYSU D00873]
MRIISAIVVLVATAFSCSAQTLKITKSAGDLSHAILIHPNINYSFTNSPLGYGSIQEFPKNAYRASFVFKEEKNTVWFIMPIGANGCLTFEISPKSEGDDFDWMIYKYSHKLAKEITKDIARPVRSNISRTDPAVSGKTGMKEGYQNSYAVPGPGRSFSKPLDVKKGDTLAFVIDNIYHNGSGFSFKSSLSNQIPLTAKLSGKIISSSTKKPLAGKVICEDDSTGIQLSETVANSSGNYIISVPINRPINIIAKHGGYLFATEDVELNQKIDTVNFNLDPVIAGNKAILFNIHFAPNKDLILPNSYPDISRLIEFLKAYPDYDIRIIGHTNSNPFTEQGYLQRLSFFRATAVKKRLIASGIKEDRLSCMGKGGKQPLTTSKVQKEAMKNLRVEIELQSREEEEVVQK